MSRNSSDGVNSALDAYESPLLFESKLDDQRIIIPYEATDQEMELYSNADRPVSVAGGTLLRWDSLSLSRYEYTQETSDGAPAQDSADDIGMYANLDGEDHPPMSKTATIRSSIHEFMMGGEAAGSGAVYGNDEAERRTAMQTASGVYYSLASLQATGPARPRSYTQVQPIREARAEDTAAQAFAARKTFSLAFNFGSRKQNKTATGGRAGLDTVAERTVLSPIVSETDAEQAHFHPDLWQDPQEPVLTGPTADPMRSQGSVTLVTAGAEQVYVNEAAREQIYSNDAVEEELPPPPPPIPRRAEGCAAVQLAADHEIYDSVS